MCQVECVVVVRLGEQTFLCDRFFVDTPFQFCTTGFRPRILLENENKTDQNRDDPF